MKWINSNQRSANVIGAIAEEIGVVLKKVWEGRNGDLNRPGFRGNHLNSIKGGARSRLAEWQQWPKKELEPILRLAAYQLAKVAR